MERSRAGWVVVGRKVPDTNRKRIVQVRVEDVPNLGSSTGVASTLVLSLNLEADRTLGRTAPLAVDSRKSYQNPHPKPRGSNAP